MVRCRNGVGCVFVFLVVDDGIDIAVKDVVYDVLAEVFCLVGTAAVVPFDSPQVVDDVAAAPNQVALFTKRSKLSPDFDTLFRF